MAMPTWIKNFLNPYSDDEDEYEGYTPPAPPMPQTSTSPSQAKPSYGGFASAKGEGGSKVTTIHATAQLQVYFAKPTTFEASATVASHLLERQTVVLNLEDTDKPQSRRILDFLSGVVYAQKGNIKQVAVNTYLITPYNVDIFGDIVDELENNGVF
ncbi:MAG: cell division protein SepF [Oscillospiraceae bacterium]|jgi:cell division inhibitor SepF|nr:cell division protein SepF [Oscillospiraceae bacterium]